MPGTCASLINLYCQTEMRQPRQLMPSHVQTPCMTQAQFAVIMMTCEGESAHKKFSRISSTSGDGHPSQSSCTQRAGGAHTRKRQRVFLKKTRCTEKFQNITPLVRTPTRLRSGCVPQTLNRLAKRATAARGGTEEEEGGHEGVEGARTDNCRPSLIGSLHRFNNSVFSIGLHYFSDHLPASSASGSQTCRPPLSRTERGSWSRYDLCTLRSSSSPAASGNEYPASRRSAGSHYR